MSSTETMHNPLCEFAITLEFLKDSWNYTPGYGEKLALPYTRIEGKNVGHDSFIFHPSANQPTKWWTWNTLAGELNEPVDLRVVGVVPWEDGSWSSSFVIADAMAFKLIEKLLA